MPVNKAREERRQKIKKEIESLEAKSAHPVRGLDSIRKIVTYCAVLGTGRLY